MAFSEHERYRVEKPVKAFIETRRPPMHLRSKLDLGYRIVGQSVELYEIRPAFQRPGESIEHGIAKATYVKSRHAWKVYWLRADLKWHRYDPCATVPTIDAFIAEVDQDRHGCFFG